ncbi:MAG: Holliday junction resolvase RuvX [Sedimentisphaerales bacterium]
MRYLAIDYGTKSTGLAICDPSETIVSPLAVLSNGKDLADRIVEIVKAESVSAVVFGLPLNMDGSSGNQAKIVQDFAGNLVKMVTVPIYFQDERLSTFAAQEKLRAADLTRKKKRRRLDAVAAAEILQAFLDSKRTPQSQ